MAVVIEMDASCVHLCITVIGLVEIDNPITKHRGLQLLPRQYKYICNNFHNMALATHAHTVYHPDLLSKQVFHLRFKRPKIIEHHKCTQNRSIRQLSVKAAISKGSSHSCRVTYLPVI